MATLLKDEQAFAVATEAMAKGNVDLTERVLNLTGRFVLLDPRNTADQPQRYIVAETHEIKPSREEAIKKCLDEFNQRPRCAG